MKIDDEHFDDKNDEESEKFSDDPEEQLRIENELLRLQLQAETGADIHQLDDVPPEVENAFLNNILAFERQLDTAEEMSIYRLLGEPTDFPNENELDDRQVENELERLENLMLEKHIAVDYNDDYPARLKYKFITEELFLHETQQFDIPEMVNHFIYEEFHPNHKLLIEGTADDFLNMWLSKNIDESSYIFNDELSSEGNTYPKAQLFQKINNIFDAYLSFENGEYNIASITYEENENSEGQRFGYAEGMIRYDAILESKEALEIKAPFRLDMKLVNSFWELTGISMPGI